MITKFIAWLKRQVGSAYVWGGQGEIDFDEAWIRKMETSETNAKRVIAFCNRQKEKGVEHIAAYDCSGLIVRFFLDNKLIAEDTTSRGLYSMSVPIEREKLSRGDLVFRSNVSGIYHVGVYVGDYMVIHAKGRDDGVVLEHIDRNGEDYWNKFARYEKLSKMEDVHFPRLMSYGGATYVNLRSQPKSTTDKNIIGKVSGDDDILVLAIDDGWADIVKYCDDDTYLRGYCISKYLEELG